MLDEGEAKQYLIHMCSDLTWIDSTFVWTQSF